MALLFELSMPNVGSWNGQWSGAGKAYLRVRNLGQSKKAKARAAELAGQSFHYSFGDGWAALVRVSEITGRDITKARNRSAGFCGYDWMIDSIIRCGEIKPRDRKD